MEKILRSIFTKLGEDNKAVYSVLTIAIFKGIFRPTFTMMDKKTDPKTKKYAAFREGLTEAIAFASYLAVDKLLEPLAGPITKNCPQNFKKVKSVIGLLGVCASAAFVIPAVCNLTLNPIMNAVTKAKNNKKPAEPSAVLAAPAANQTEQKPNYPMAYNPVNGTSRMRVG